MKLEKAIKQMGAGDVFKCKSGDQIRFDSDNHLRFVSSNVPVFMNLENINREGEIIPAEPKVLTTEEYDKKIKETSPRSGDCQRCWIQGNRHGFQQGHQNGRLERDLELRPLVEACLEFRNLYYPHVIDSREEHSKAINSLLRETGKLKPLKAE